MKYLSVIKRPVITEKATRLQEQGKYVFLVDTGATKNEIRKAVKEFYKVDAVSIATIREKPVRKRFRNKITMKAGGKKAIVTLKEGQKIEI